MKKLPVALALAVLTAAAARAQEYAETAGWEVDAEAAWLLRVARKYPQEVCAHKYYNGTRAVQRHHGAGA